MRKASLLPIFLTVVIDLLGFGIVLPLLPLYADQYGASPLMIGLLFTSFSAMQFVFAPLWGRWSDVIGRRPVILIGLGGSFASYLLFAFAGHYEVLALLFVSRITAGVFGGTISTAYAYIADVTTTEERGRGMTLIGIAFGLGFTLGPAIGGLGHAIAPIAPGLIAAGFSLTAFAFAWRRLGEPERHAEGTARTWLDLAALRTAMATPSVPLILLLGFVAITCFSLMESTLGLLGKHVYEFDYVRVGLLFSYLGFWSALTQGFLVRRFMKRVGELRFVILGAITLAGGMLGLALSEQIAVLAVVAPLPVLGFGMMTPSLNSLLSRRTDPAVQGGILGVNQSLQSMARIVGPMVGLPLFGIDHARPFLAGAGLMVVAVALAALLARMRSEDRS